MIFAPFVVHLHIYRRLISLYVTSGKQLVPHAADDRIQHFANPHHRIIKR